MLQRFLALYRRYETAHLKLALPGGAIRDAGGDRVGYIDRIFLGQGRLQVQGWAEARSLRLIHGGAEVQMAPVLRRADVASALGIPETVGFDLTLPARIEDLARADPPGLVVTRDPGLPPVHPLSLPVAPPARARWRLRAAFARDLALCLPAILGWALTGNILYRARIKRRLGLGLQDRSGPLERWLFRQPQDTDPQVPACRITIVLPVYNAFELLQDCLARVERHTDLPWRLILVEDGSTDARVLPWLRDWAAGRDRVELLEHPENRGFIAAVNRGLKRARRYEAPRDGIDEGPVILLNSDALVPEGWASRLVRPFLRHRDVATVTPMSNDAEIFSVPQICARMMLTPGQGDAIDAVARRFAPEALLSVAPTGVGFCMAMGRDWLARVPQLDPAFGRGYGEEVDWCQKVAAMGGRHLGLPGLFVEHRGGESFGSAEKVALVARNNRIVSGRYPGYDQSVQEFIAADPMRTARLALGLAWAGSLEPGRAVPVYLAHAMGGGADHWLEHRIAEDLEADRPSVVLRVGTARRWQLELITPLGRTTGQSDEAETIRALLAVLPRRRMIYSCGVGDPDPVAIPDMLVSLLQQGDDAEILFHDFYPLTPAYTLLDSDGVFRGPVVAPRADAAHHTRRPDGREVTLEDWQAAWKAFAVRADLVVFSEDSAAQVAAVWPDLADRIRVRPHRLLHEVPRLPAAVPGAPPVLAVLGNINLQKGAGVVQALARRYDRDWNGDRNEPAKTPKIVLIGNIDPTYALPASMPVHGTYAIADLPQLAARHGVTHWLIPSIWPETFCYTVHEALMTGLPVLVFDLGAQAEAARRAENGVVLPFDLEAGLAQRVLDAVIRDTRPGQETTRHAEETEELTNG